MASSTPTHQNASSSSSFPTPLSMLLPKPLSRALTSTYLRHRHRILILFLAILICLLFLHTFRPPSARRRRLQPLSSRSYAGAVVRDCVHRTPTETGRTFETIVRGVQASFVSWTKNEAFDKDIVRLRTHEAVRIISKFQRPATLLDVGANIGKVAFPVLALPHTHTVIAVEPVETNVNLLCMTANLNGWLANPGFTLLKAALSDSTGKMEIFVPEGREDNAALSSDAATANVHNPKHGEKVHVLVADDVLAEGGFEPDVIKIDTQGHELHVLRGLKRYLRAAKPGKVLVMAESDPKLMRLSGVDPADIYQLMTTELRYSSYCKASIEVEDGKLVVQGEILTKESYPPGGCRDIFYFKQP